MLTLYTFGDSILDSGAYNEKGLTAGQLLLRNDDRLFPEFRGQDLLSRGHARLEERAVDGSTTAGLADQAKGVQVHGTAIALVSIGGNDFLQAITSTGRFDAVGFARRLDRFLSDLPIRRVYIGNVYDPTFGDDTRNFLPLDPKTLRSQHRLLNQTIAEVASRRGKLVDLHSHFLQGDPSWFVGTIEPSLQGTSEIRRCFLPFVLAKK